MDDALIYAILFAAGIAFGYPIGKIATAKKLESLVHRMGQAVIDRNTRILELEEEVVDLIASRDEVGTLERWMRN